MNDLLNILNLKKLLKGSDIEGKRVCLQLVDFLGNRWVDFNQILSESYLEYCAYLD